MDETSVGVQSFSMCWLYDCGFALFQIGVVCYSNETNTTVYFPVRVAIGKARVASFMGAMNDKR